jgi:hypothetical protein
VNFEVANQQIGTVRSFSYRPDAASTLGRPDLGQCGWGALLFLPRLPDGLHEIIPRAVDSDGNSAELPSIRLQIVG